jgi:hypothetical protein
MATAYPAVGVSVALAGADKLLGDHAYERMFEHLGWSRSDMIRLGSAELLGGLLLAARPTRRLGGAIVLTASLVVLAAEIRRGQMGLAASRAGVILAALGALAAPGRR